MIIKYLYNKFTQNKFEQTGFDLCANITTEASNTLLLKLHTNNLDSFFFNSILLTLSSNLSIAECNKLKE